MSKTIQILIFEPSFIVFEGLTAFLKRFGEQYSITKVEDFNELHNTILRKEIDIVMMNPSIMQSAQKQINTLKGEYPKLRLIAIIYSIFPESVLSLFDGRFSITDTPNAVHECIKQTLNNQQTATDDGVDTLSEREVDVLKLLATGNANKEIADKLNISINTVITHRKNISQKTGIKSLSGLTIYAVVKKIVSLDVIVASESNKSDTM